MRLSILLGCGLLLAATPSYAAPAPTGEWVVANGHGHVRIENCGGALWGVVSWEERPGHDTENPDPALRGRPTLGMPILLDMKPTTVNNWGNTEQRWKGEVYSPENGKTYSASIWLTSPNTMRIEGCVLGGIFCGGQEWTRVPQAASTAPSRPKSGKTTARTASKSTPKTRGSGNKSVAAAEEGSGSSIDVCSRVSELAGRSH
jgi:uncharacterized protein (DUF2147 family)